MVHLESEFVTPSALQCGLSELDPGRGQQPLPPRLPTPGSPPGLGDQKCYGRGCPRNGACTRGTTGWLDFTSSHFCFTCGDLAKGQVTKREGRTYKETPESWWVSLRPQALPLCTWSLCIPLLFHAVLMVRVRWHFLPFLRSHCAGERGSPVPLTPIPRNHCGGLGSGFLVVPCHKNKLGLGSSKDCCSDLKCWRGPSSLNPSSASYLF